jgi:Calcineurin-like phosphoesterase
MSDLWMKMKVMKRAAVFISIGTVSLLISVILLPSGWYGVQSSIGARDVPSYHGHSAIDPSKNQFVIVGDTRGKSPWEFWVEKPGNVKEEILDEIVKRNPAFVINLGDMVLRSDSERCWLEFDSLHAEIREKVIPFFPVLGNHELKGSIEAGLRHYFARFPHLHHQRWYSFEWKNIGFIVLDSNLSSLRADQRENQIRWFAAELQRFEDDVRVEHVIVCIHEPPFTNRVKTSLGREPTRLFSDLFVAFKKTRLFFSGHVHSYERFRIGSKHFIVSGGGGAPRGKLVIDRSKRRYEDQFSGGGLRFFHICLVEVRGDSLLFKVLRMESDGSFSEADGLTLSPQS